jgi:hypothetical protein
MCTSVDSALSRYYYSYLILNRLHTCSVWLGCTVYVFQCCQRLGFYPNNIIRIFEHQFCFISICKLGILGFLSLLLPKGTVFFHDYLRVWGMFLRICQKIMAALRVCITVLWTSCNCFQSRLYTIPLHDAYWIPVVVIWRTTVIYAEWLVHAQ